MRVVTLNDGTLTRPAATLSPQGRGKMLAIPPKPGDPMKHRILPILFSVLACAASSRAEIKLPAVIGDHMVLQRGNPRVFGQAAPGKTIRVTLAGVKATATADEAGKWKAVLGAVPSGGPYKLVISGDGAVTVKDVLVGDVWLGSGQSNMEFTLARTHDAAARLPKADDPSMRLFTVKQATSAAPADDLQGSWKVCTPDAAKDFSAVAYHFGREMRQALKVPVGLIVSAWGGTAGESWLPRPAMEAEPRLMRTLRDFDNNKEQIAAWGDGAPYELQMSDIRLKAGAGGGEDLPVLLTGGGKGLGGAWKSFVDPGSTGAFTEKGKGPMGGPCAVLSGVMKGKCWITLSTPLKSDNSAVDLGAYDSVEFYAKGNGPFRMKLSQPSITDYNYYATDVFKAPAEWTLMKFPIRSLKQGMWGTPKSFTPNEIKEMVITVEVPYNPEIASVAYNAMIAPLASFDVKGVLWYQGESNAGRAAEYDALLSVLVKSWREAWGRELPFFIVQLPNFMAVQPEPSESSWAELREAQLKAASLPGVGVVTTIDLGVADNIHPTNKTEVGRRIALAALGMVFKRPVVFSGPLFESLTVQDGKMALTFKETGKGLSTSDGKPVTGFAVSDDEGDFRWADAKITGPKTLEVWNDKVPKPVEVRYAWADNPVCNLTNKEGLPASPFRFGAQPVAAGESPFFEPWKSAGGTGVYADTKGSRMTFAIEKGPEKGQKAVHLTYELLEGGHCGLWRNASYDLSGKKKMIFQARATLPGEVQVALKDKWNVQYVAKVQVRFKQWTKIKISFSDFEKDPYYTPPNAEPGHPMDFSQVSGMNFGPQAKGKGEIWIGPVLAE
jgi:sialate O-acetylesterase